MTSDQIHQAAQIIWDHISQEKLMHSLPIDCRPENKEEGHSIQKELLKISGQKQLGYKIAATSKAGQRHINVPGPQFGRLLSERVFKEGQTLNINHNPMGVLEAEFGFRMKKNISPRGFEYSLEEVSNLCENLYLMIEIPDSRYVDFTSVGEYQLIADNACASWLVEGKKVDVDWKSIDLSKQEVKVFKNGKLASVGIGKNALDGPLKALLWLVNDLLDQGETLKKEEVVTTGTVHVPVPIWPGDEIRADFGLLGDVRVKFSE